MITISKSLLINCAESIGLFIACFVVSVALSACVYATLAPQLPDDKNHQFCDKVLWVVFLISTLIVFGIRFGFIVLV